MLNCGPVGNVATETTTDRSPRISSGLSRLQYLIGGHVLERLNDSGRPANLDFVGNARVSEAEVNRSGARRSIAACCRHVIELRLACRRELDPGADAIAIALCSPKRKLKPVIVPRAVVDPDLRWSTERGDNNIELSIAIEVRNRGAAMPARRQSGEACFLREGGPCPAQITKHGVGLVQMKAVRHVGRSYISAADKDVFPTVIVEVVDVDAVP